MTLPAADHLIYIPVILVLGFVLGFGAMGIWAGLVAGLAVAGLLLNARFWGVIVKRLAV